ncbi:MAG: M15 family metallopeptidase [Lachnospiraceae bacterium]|nr:M15 family metallopeptidase [Lachnospiraceae bacterium]
MEQQRSRRPRQQRGQAQQNTPRKSRTIKKLLWVILIFEIITAIELLALIKVLAANEQYAGKLGRETVSASTSGVQNTEQGDSGHGAKDSQSNAEDGNKKNAAEEDWKLVLVNKWNEMDPDYVPELEEVADGHRVDARIADSLKAMLKGAKKAGYDIYILSSYRDMDKQTYLYEAEVEEWLALGYSRRGAEEKAATVVAYPGTSEHHLGLAVDLVSSEHVALDEGAERTEGYQWLVAHCHEYGFILRYPNGATEITGIIYEPWHFRYVGEEAATEIMESGITLEEYLE